jgi:hypothetical protein
MITFFLDNWSDVRGSEAMRHVWQQIRLGGHPEEGETLGFSSWFRY